MSYTPKVATWESSLVDGWVPVSGECYYYWESSLAGGFWSAYLETVVSGFYEGFHDICYAVEINTGTSLTDASLGIVSGVFRFVTGRPHYDGSTVIPEWGPNETSSGVITDVWYQGFLTKDGLSNPMRTIDIQGGGNYGTRSAFTLNVRNNQLFWKSLLANNISLINKPVRTFAVIDNVFYQIWDGVVQQTPRTLTEFKVGCSDESASVHKDMPSRIINNETVPVVLGDVGYLKATRVSTSTVIPLTSTKTSCAIYAYNNNDSGNPTNTLDKTSAWTLQLLTTGKSFATNELQGKYIKITAFNVSPDDPEDSREADLNNLLYIKSSAATFSSLGFNITNVICDAAPKCNPPFNDLGGAFNSYTFNSNTYTTKAKINLINDCTMYVQCIDLNNTYVLGQSGVTPDVSEIYKYDSDTNSYIKIPIGAKDNGDGTITLDGGVGVNNEDLVFYHPLSATINAHWWWSTLDARMEYASGLINYSTKTFSVTVLHNELGTEPGVPKSVNGMFKGYDFDYGSTTRKNNFIYANYSGTYLFNGSTTTVSGTLDTSGLYFISNNGDNTLDGTIVFNSGSYTDFNSAASDHDYDTYVEKSGLANVFALETYITINTPIGDSDDIYIMPDFSIDTSASNRYVQIEWRGIDHTGRVITPPDDSDEGGIRIREYISTPTAYQYFHGLNESYYFGYDLPEFSVIPALNNWYETAEKLDPSGNAADDSFSDFGNELFKLPEYLRDYLANGTIKHLKVKFTISNGVVTPRSIKLHELAVLTKKTQPLDSELYIKQLGTSVSINSVPTNTVYGMFKYILEENDGIASGNIVYNNLPDVRQGNWLTGRIYTDVKNSKEYLRELCCHSFTALYPNRKGQREFNCWLDATSSGMHDQSGIVKDSIDSFELTPVTNVFNVFDFSYDYDYGKKSYKRQLKVYNTSATTFPDYGSDYSSYVVGIDDYNVASGLWHTARNGYLLTGTNYSPGTGYDLLPNYVYTNGINDYTSPVLYLTNMINWTSRQKYEVSYAIPLTSGNIDTELTKTVYVRHKLFTDNSYYKGYITEITYDIAKNQIKLKALLEPNDGFECYILPSGITDFRIDAEDYALPDRSGYSIFDANDRSIAYNRMWT